jgi:hypothetical protein
MGGPYLRRLQQRWGMAWLDLPPRPDKSPEVGVWWQVGGGHPLGMMTYRDDVSSAGVFCRLSALMMWYGDIPGDLAPDVREDDPPIHGNALWYMAQYLFDDQLLARTLEPRARGALLLQQLAGMFRNFHEEAIKAEIELYATREITQGRPPTGRQISERQLALLRSYLPGVRVEPAWGGYWMTSGQTFYGETDPVFAMAASAGAALAEKVTRGDRRAIDGLQRTCAGDSQFSYDLLLGCGVDLADPVMHRALARRFESRLAELEALVAGGMRA